MTSIKNLDKYCRKHGKRIVLDGNIHKGFLNVELSDEQVTKKAINKHKRGKVL